MPSPVVPSQFEACVIATEDPPWLAIAKLHQLEVLWLQWRCYAYNANGTFTDQFIQDMCEARCRALSSKENPTTYNNCTCTDSEGQKV